MADISMAEAVPYDGGDMAIEKIVEGIRALENYRHAYCSGIGSPWIVLALDNHYPDSSSLCLDGLRGRDVAIVQKLREATASLPLDVFLLEAEQRLAGSCASGSRRCYIRNRQRPQDFRTDWHNMYTDFTSDAVYNIPRLVDLDGTHIAEDVQLSENDVYVDMKDRFALADGKEIKFDDELEDYMAFAVHSYRISWMRRFCDYIWKQPRTGNDNPPRISRPAARCVLEALVRMRDWEFFVVFIKETLGCFDYKAVFPAVVKMIEDPKDPLTMTGVGNPSLALAVLAEKRVANAIKAIELMEPPLPSAGPPMEGFARANHRKWCKMALDLLLLMLDFRPIGYADGKALANHFVTRYDIDYIKSRLLPDMPMEREDKEAFLMGIATQIGKQCLENPNKDTTKWRQAFISISKAVVAKMNIPAISAVSTERELYAKAEAKFKSEHESIRESSVIKSHHKKELASIKHMMLLALEPRWLVRFYEQLLTIGSRTTIGIAQDLSRRIGREAVALVGLSQEDFARKESTLKELWFPFLRLLMPVLEKHLLFFTSPAGDAKGDYLPFKNMYTDLLDAYLDNVIGSYPDQSVRKWPVRPLLPRRCCTDCRAVNKFLADHSRDEMELPVAVDRQMHVRRQISCYTSSIKCQTWDGGRKNVHCRKRLQSRKPLDPTVHYRSYKSQTIVLSIKKVGPYFPHPIKLWEKNCAAARAVFDTFPRAGFKKLLGNEYERIFDMTYSREPEPLNLPQAEKDRRKRAALRMIERSDSANEGVPRRKRFMRSWPKSSNPYRFILDEPPRSCAKNKMRRPRSVSPNAAKAPLDPFPC
ncbi:hypothetical protein SBRCBS47491_000894 [Sporothrix bragantina]|uniref:Uncharacterized protein n=1 Tax=Sporothrix bragantina TaxID=671064 RepID=A0ABP0AU35_9PEZI